MVPMESTEGTKKKGTIRPNLSNFSSGYSRAGTKKREDLDIRGGKQQTKKKKSLGKTHPLIHVGSI